jgi:ATP-dependent helicase IRC3
MPPKLATPTQEILTLNESGVPSIRLRPYQYEALEAIYTSREGGQRRLLVALPTGTGKTIIFAELIRQVGGRALILAHRDELIGQAAEKLRMTSPSLTFGIVKAARNEIDSPVVLASVQTISRAPRLRQLAPNFGLVVVDEAHHATAVTYERTLQYLRCFEADGPLLVGFTATPERGDHVTLKRVLERIVYQRSILEMIPDYLCDLRAKRISLEADFSALHVRHGDFVDEEVEEVLMEAEAPQHVAEAYLAHAAGRKALIFTPTVKVAYAMRKAFKDAGFSAIEALDGQTPPEQRRAILRRLRTGDTQIVSNCCVLTEGFDEPSLACIIIARPTRSRPFYVQMLGRGTRKFPGKADCLLMDVCGNTERHDVLSLWMLFDLPDDALEDATLTEALKEQASKRRIKITTADGQLVAVDVNLFRSRPMRWLAIGSAHHCLPIKDGFIVLSAVGEKWEPRRLMNDKSSVPIGPQLTLEYALGFAEDYVRRLGDAVLVEAGAMWRDAPMTDKQQRFMAFLGHKVTPDMTRGQVSDLIAIAKASMLLHQPAAREVAHD